MPVCVAETSIYIDAALHISPTRNSLIHFRITVYRVNTLGTPYTRGRSREYAALKILRSKGWLCSRSAASHGAVDIFAGKDGKVLIIQVKSGKARMGGKSRVELKSWAEAYGARAEVWFFQKRRGVKREVVYDGREQNSDPQP